MKWLFEEVIISLLRCFFYCTEKQKEYSKIFYYRKAIWALVMKMATEDLNKDNLQPVSKQEMKHSSSCNLGAEAHYRNFVDTGNYIKLPWL